MNKKLIYAIIFIGLMGILFIFRGDLNALASSEEPTKEVGFGQLVQQAVDSLMNKQLEEAEAQVQEILILKPDYPIGYMLLAAIYQSQGENEKCKGAIDKAIELAPEDTTYFDKILTSSSEQLNKEFIELLESSYYYRILSSEDKTIRSGFILYLKALDGDLEKYDQAINEFKTVLKINPQNAEAYKHLGDCYYQKYKNESAKEKRNKYLYQAQSNYEKATKIDQKYLEELIFMADVYAADKMGEKLAALYIKILKLDPENKQAMEFMVLQEREKKRGDKSKELREKMEDMKRLKEEHEKMEFYQLAEVKYNRNPSDANAAFDLGIAYWDKAKEGHEEFLKMAEKMLRKTVELSPTFLLARYKLGEFYLENDQKEEAANQFEEIQIIDPNFDNKKMRNTIAEVEQQEDETL